MAALRCGSARTARPARAPRRIAAAATRRAHAARRRRWGSSSHSSRPWRCPASPCPCRRTAARAKKSARLGKRGTRVWSMKVVVSSRRFSVSNGKAPRRKSRRRIGHAVEGVLRRALAEPPGRSVDCAARAATGAASGEVGRQRSVVVTAARPKRRPT